MLARSVGMMVLAGCFSMRTPAERPHALRANAAEAVVGIVVAAVGIGLIRTNPGSDAGRPIDAYVGGAQVIAGGIATLGGTIGFTLAGFDFTPTSANP